MSDTPRIWVGCLAAYNAGTHHGKWIDCDQDVDDIWHEIYTILQSSPEPNVMADCLECDGDGCEACGDAGKVPSSEEWHICDWENFCGYQPGRYGSIEKIAEVAAAIEEYGAELYAAAVAFAGEEYAENALRYQYCGEYDSAADYAAEFADQSGLLSSVPRELECHIDWDGYARDLCAVEVRINGTVYIFANG